MYLNAWKYSIFICIYHITWILVQVFYQYCVLELDIYIRFVGFNAKLVQEITLFVTCQ